MTRILHYSLRGLAAGTAIAAVVAVVAPAWVLLRVPAAIVCPDRGAR